MTGDIPRAIAARRWAPLAEAAVLVALAWLANRTLGWEDPGSARSLFSAYLIAVVAIAGRYGMAPGVVAAGLATAAAAGSRAGALGVPLGSYFTAGAGGPATVTLWLAALAVGAVADRHRAALATLVGDHQRTRARIAKLEAEYREALEEKDLEERRVLADEGTFGAVVALLDDLDREEPSEVPERLVRALRRLMSGGTAAIYRVPPDGPLVRAHGDEADWPEELEVAREPVLFAAIASGRIASVASLPPDESLRPDRVLAACPLEADGERLVLAAGALPFVAFAPDRLAALAGCARIAARALERARLFAATHDRNVVDRETQTCAFPFFRARLTEEMALARRHGKPLCVIALRDAELVDDAARSTRRAHLATALKTALREGDLAAHYTSDECFVLLLPFTNTAGARVVAGRLKEGLAAAGAVHVVEIHAKTSRVEDVLATIEWRLTPAKRPKGSLTATLTQGLKRLTRDDAGATHR